MPRKEKKIGLWALLLGTLACWMSTNTFPWGWLGALPVAGKFLLAVQFPWRYFSLGTLLLVVVSVCAVSALRRGQYARPVAVLLLSASLLGVGIFYHSYLPTVNTAYLGDSAQMIYADNKVSNQAWYYDSLYLPDGAVETRDGFVCNTVVTTVEISSVTRRNGGDGGQLQGEHGTDGPCGTAAALLSRVYHSEHRRASFPHPQRYGGYYGAGRYSGDIQVAFREPKRWLAADLVSLATLLALAAGFAVCKRKKRA